MPRRSNKNSFDVTSLRLYKKEKLCSEIAIDALFSRRVSCVGATGAALSYPLRIVWRRNNGRPRGAEFQFLISVPKKKLRHAVDRVTMRRRIREAYRLNRDLLPPEEAGRRVDMAFVYVADSLQPYAAVERSVRKLIKRMAENLTNEPDAGATDNEARD